MAEGFASGMAQGMEVLRQERSSAVDTQMKTMQLDQMKQQAAMEQDFRRRMQSVEQGEGVPMDPSEQLDAIGKLQIQSGMVNQGTKTLESAASLRAKQAAAATTQARAAEYRMNVVKSNAQLMGSLIGSVTDEASWNRANTLYAMQTGMMSPFAQTKYSPDLVKQVRDQSMTAFQKADLAIKQARLKQQEESAKLLDKKRGLEVDKLKRDVEGGVKPGKAGTRTPPKQMTALASNLINSNFNILSTDEQSLLGERVAEDAMELMQRNPALKTSEAMSQAYLRRLQAGDFKSYTPIKKMEPKELPALPDGFQLGEPTDMGDETSDDTGEE